MVGRDEQYQCIVFEQISMPLVPNFISVLSEARKNRDAREFRQLGKFRFIYAHRKVRTLYQHHS
jgi:hypothetical protein